MAMKKCKECGKEVSTSAKVCPNCGIKYPAGGMTTGVKLVLALLILTAIGQVISENNIATPSKSSLEYLYAINEAECYQGPSEQSGRFFFKPTAEAPLTLNRNERYRVLAKNGNWIQVYVFGSSPWVRASDLVPSLNSATVAAISKERLDSFNYVQSMGNRKAIHAGAMIEGHKLILMVNDSWHSLSSDMKEQYIKNSVSTFVGMGGARGIQESASDYTIEVRHSNSNRVLATMEPLLGIKLTQ